MAENQIIVFAKAPQHGRVKTRMQPQLPPAQSVRLHKRLLQQTLLTCTSVTTAKTELWCSPDKRSRHCRKLAQRLELPLKVQRGRGLGQRMGYALNAYHSNREGATVLIGSDCPEITAHYLQRAFLLLKHSEVIFGPALDGGYVLIGSRIRLPAKCFNNVEWGSEKVLAQSCNNMEKAGISYSLLPVLQDIDRPEDLAGLDITRLHRMRWLFGIE